jgi:hypothetical protein
VRYLQQAGQAIQFKIPVSQDLAACIGDGGHMGAALLQQLASGDRLSRGRFIAGPVHQPGEKDPGVQVEAGLWIGRTRHVQQTPAAESAIGQRNGPGTARRAGNLIDFGSNG